MEPFLLYAYYLGSSGLFENELAFIVPSCHDLIVLFTERPALGPPLSAENREKAKMLSPEEEKTPPIFPIVCIGGSAGSLSAFTDILEQMPARPGMAIVIVAHRAVEESGRLLVLLGNATGMQVVEVTEGTLLEPNHIFVAPPHREITTDGVALRLARVTRHNGWPTLISEFLFTLASTGTSRAIAIIVSGVGHDGSNALAAIKEAGGKTFAQSDAQYPDMPEAAVDTNHVDHLLTARQIGGHLATLNA